MSLIKRKVASETDRRNGSRQATIKRAVISLETECAVFDLSDKGARLLLRGPMTLPESFKLSIGAGPAKICRVCWRKGNEVGVEFAEVIEEPAPPPSPAGADKRRAKREAIFDKGMIVYNDGFCTMDCAVIDYSVDGAKLKPLRARDCPVYFQLRIKHGPTRSCMVVRRSGAELAVRFLPD